MFPEFGGKSDRQKNRINPLIYSLGGAGRIEGELQKTLESIPSS
jgi:hypothetical protein